MEFTLNPCILISFSKFNHIATPTCKETRKYGPLSYGFVSDLNCNRKKEPKVGFGKTTSHLHSNFIY